MKNTKDKKLKMLMNQLKVEDLIIYIHQFRRLTFRLLFLLRLMKPVGTGTLILILEWSYSLQFCNFCSTWATKTIEVHCVKSVQIRSFFWSVFSRIWTRKSSVFGKFHTVMVSLTHTRPILHFCIPWKQKTSGFPTFLGGKEMERWPETG